MARAVVDDTVAVVLHHDQAEGPRARHIRVGRPERVHIVGVVRHQVAVPLHQQLERTPPPARLAGPGRVRALVEHHVAVVLHHKLEASVLRAQLLHLRVHHGLAGQLVQSAAEKRERSRQVSQRKTGLPIRLKCFDELHNTPEREASQTPSMVELRRGSFV